MSTALLNAGLLTILLTVIVLSILGAGYLAAWISDKFGILWGVLLIVLYIFVVSLIAELTEAL
jgi:hypothetical protein